MRHKTYDIRHKTGYTYSLARFKVFLITNSVRQLDIKLFWIQDQTSFIQPWLQMALNATCGIWHMTPDMLHTGGCKMCPKISGP